MSIELRGPTPIYVGISGHRDLRDGDGIFLEKAVDDFFGQLAKRYPNSDIVLLTGLAAGADQLGARRASACGIAYVAVLPMPLGAYRNDFAPCEREGFEAALAGAASVVELPVLPDVSVEALDDAQTRARQYAALGRYLVDHSAVLLALYNGMDVTALGGTGYVVAQARESRASRGKPAPAFVYEISTPRKSDDATHHPPFHTSSLDDGDPSLAALASIDRWNARAVGSYALDEGLCARTFAVADACAIDYQHATHRTIDYVYWCTLASTVALQAYEDLDKFVPAAARIAQLFGAAFLGCAVAAVLLVRRLRENEVENRFQDYRVLAEGLRVQCALLEAGLDVDASTRYGDAGDGNLSWVLRAIDVAYVTYALTAPPSPPRSFLERARHSPWLVDQRAYYERAAARNRNNARRANQAAVRWLRCSITAGVLVALDGLLHFVHPVRLFGDADDRIQSAIVLALGLTGTVAAIVKGKSSLRGFGVLATRYAAMFATFDRAFRRLAEADVADDAATAIFVGLADAALVESAQWHSSERSRPLESVWGG